MKFRIVCLLFVAISYSSFAQVAKESKFSLNSFYGLAYSRYAEDNNYYPIDLSVPAIGSFYGMELEFKIPEDRHLGFSFSRQVHAKTIDQLYTITNGNIGILLNDFRVTNTTLFFDVHLRRKVAERLNFTVGLYYFLEYEHTFDIEEVDSEFYYTITDINKARADDFGPMVAVDYMLPVRDYLEFGLQGRAYFNLAGFQSAELHPTVRVKF